MLRMFLRSVALPDISVFMELGNQMLILGGAATLLYFS